MKNIYFYRIWVLISVLILTYSQAWATDVSITFSDKYNSNTTLDETEITIATGITATFNKRSGGTATQYYTNGTSVRWYGGGTLVIASSVGNITGVSITYTRTDNSISADVGTWESPDWSGSATSITFTQGGTSGHLRISAISVTYTASAPATPYTVTFTKTDGTTQAITEASVGGGVTPPTMQATCGDWEFQGWSITESDDDESTDELTLVTLTTGKYYPSSNITLYPVYTKEDAGGTVFSSYSKVNGGSAISSGKYLISTGSFTVTTGRKNGTSNSQAGGASFIPGNTEQTTYEVTITGTKDEFTIRCSDGYYIGGGSSTSLAFSTSTPSTDAYKWVYTSTGIQNKNTTTRYIRANGTTDFRFYTTSNGSEAFLYKRNESSGTTTYYYSYPTCTPPCTELGQINGPINLTQSDTPTPTSLKASWSMSANTGIASYTIKVYDSSDNLVKTIESISNSATTQNITGLSPCTTYYAELYTVSSGSPYCEGGLISTSSKTPAAGNTTTGYTITYMKSNVSVSSGTEVANQCNASDVDVTYSANSGFTLPSTIKVTNAGDEDDNWMWDSSTGELIILDLSAITGNVTVTITGVANACTDFSFHTGTGTDDAVKTTNTTTCFTQVNTSTTWIIENYTIPSDTKFFVGHHGYFYNDNLGSANSRSAVKTWSQEMFFEYTKSYGDGNRPTVGQATGAKGTLSIWSDNNWNNCHVGFTPQGYVFKLGSTNLNMHSSATLDAVRYWETDIQTLTSSNISGNFQVNLYTGSAGGVACDNTQSKAMTTMGVKSNSGNNWRATSIAAADANTRGFFRIDVGDGGAKNWNAHWVPTHRIIFHSNYPGGGGPADTYSVDVSVEESNSSIALASEPAAPTGYTFDGWYTAADGGTKRTGNQTISAGATADIELYAHWTANTINLTLDKNNSDASGSTDGSATIKYNGTALESETTHATRSHYTLEGYYAEAGCTHKVLTAAGALVNYSGFVESEKWVRNSATTLYAKWTPVNYTVTWYAGGTAAGNITTAGSPSTSVAYGSKVTTLPTDPDGSPCDKTFVGWTNTTSYTHGTSLLFTDAASSSTIEGNTSFYAVFATESSGSATVTYPIDSKDTFGDATGTAPTGSSASIAETYTSNAYQMTGGNNQIVTLTDWGTTTITNITLSMKSNSSSGAGYLCYSTDGGSTWIDIVGNNSTPTGVAFNQSDWYNDWSTNYVDISKDVSITGVAGNTIKIKVHATANSIYCESYSFTYSSTTYTGHTITCADCGTSVTPTFTAAPAGGTVVVTKGGAAVTSGSTVKTCESVAFSVTLTPASHYTLTNFTATGLTDGTATISPTVASTLPKTTAQTFTVTVSAGATGTLTLTPTFTEDTHVNITWMVNGSALTGIGTVEGLTFVYSGGDIESLPDEPSVPAGCSGTKVFAGWSTHNSGATEEDTDYYDDLFTVAGPTGITSAQTYYAVFATSSSNALAGQTMWAEDFSGYSDTDVPSGSTAYDHTGTTVYNSGSVTYACTNGGSDTKVYGGSQTQYSGGAASPELLIGKTSGVFAVTGIPTGGQTELTLSYKSNNSNISVSSGTSGVTIGDPSVSSGTYTYTITISQSPAVANFALSFSNTASGNSRIDDISLVVPGSSSMSDYVTTCAPSYTITYNKNTEDAVTNLPSPTSVLQSTGSGTLSSTVPSRATYTFDGWAETTSGAVAYAAGASITGVTGDKTLYAVWSKTAVEEINLNYTTLNKYVGDAAVTLEVTSVSPTGADDGVTWSSSASGVASVTAAGVVSFVAVGTATITATSTVTNTTYAVCYVTVRTKPTATFVDNIHDGNGTDLDDYALQDVAGTAIVFPTLSNTTPGTDDCESQHYVFVGWTTSDNNTDPEDHLVTSDELEDDNNKTFYAVWADGVPGYTYTQLEDDAFSTSATYVIGGESNGERYYLYNNTNSGWGYTTNDPATNTPIYFTLSGTASALVVASTEATTRYLTPMSSNSFNMSTSSQTVQLNDDGTIRNPSNEDRELRVNPTNLRWYDISSFTGGSPAYFYNVTAGSTVSYRTSCCANNVAAPVVTATNTAYTATLTWSDVANATGYEVSWNGGAWTAATSPVNKTGLTASTTYTYKVRATYTSPQCGALIASGSITTDDVYTVTYAKGTGTGSCTATGTMTDSNSPYEAGATVTLQANSYSLSGHDFAAWVVKDADDNDVAVSSNQFTMPASNVTITATWTAKQDKYYDRMHQSTAAAQGGVADGEGKYYLVREGCNYPVPSPADDSTGDTDCHTTHFKLLGWIAASHLNSDGSIKTGQEGYLFTGGGTKTATGATYYAIYAIMTE